MNNLDESTRITFESTEPPARKVMALLSSQSPAVWSALGSFCGCLRQRRRALRRQLVSMQERYHRTNFGGRKAVWQQRRNTVCRHGVFFKGRLTDGCSCMSSGAKDWTEAKFMPSIDRELKAIVVVPFLERQLRRLGQLQSEMRRRMW